MTTLYIVLAFYLGTAFGWAMSYWCLNLSGRLRDSDEI